MDLAFLLVFAAEDLHGPLAGRVHRHLADGIAVPGGDRGHLVPINTCPYTCTRTRTVRVNKKFTFDDRRTTVLRCERFRGTAFSHRFSSVPSFFRSVPFSFRSACEPARPVRGIGERFFRIRG